MSFFLFLGKVSEQLKWVDMKIVKSELDMQVCSFQTLSEVILTLMSKFNGCRIVMITTDFTFLNIFDF